MKEKHQLDQRLLICISANYDKLKRKMDLDWKTFKTKRRKQINSVTRNCFVCVFVCFSMCVHMLMGVPVCKRLKRAHVNNKRAMLVKRTCVANLLRKCKDHALICTVTGNNISALT